jgi:hypothetical protein
MIQHLKDTLEVQIHLHAFAFGHSVDCQWREKAAMVQWWHVQEATRKKEYDHELLQSGNIGF